MIPSVSFIDRLATAMKSPLPGRAAQRRFCPTQSYGRHFGATASDVQRAAVLLMLYPEEGQWFLLLTLRPQDLKDHAGQISLPGGLIESGESIEQAAIRECEEELGIPAAAASILGRLSPVHVYNTNFIVTPVLGIAEHAPQVFPNPREVARVIRLPVSELVSEENLGVHRQQKSGIEFTAPHIQWREHRIWGATAIMLGELQLILKRMDVG